LTACAPAGPGARVRATTLVVGAVDGRAASASEADGRCAPKSIEIVATDTSERPNVVRVSCDGASPRLFVGLSWPHERKGTWELTEEEWTEFWAEIDATDRTGCGGRWPGYATIVTVHASGGIRSSSCRDHGVYGPILRATMDLQRRVFARKGIPYDVDD
jgi:hypothetical protein